MVSLDRRITNDRRMRASSVAFWSLLLLWASSLCQASSQEFSGLEGLLRNAGYQLYNPPRANWGPGFVFAGDIVNGRITNVEEVCPNLYSNMGTLEGSAVILSDYRSSDNFSFNVALDFLKNLVAGALDLSAVGQRAIEVRWKNVRELSYSHMDKWLESGEPRPVATRRQAAIEDLKLKNRFKDRLFVIVRAVAPEVMVYDFSKMTDADGQGSVKFMNQLDAATKGKGHLSSNTQLVIDQRLFVGYAAPIKIEEWLPSHLMSGDIIKIRGTATNLTLE